MNAGTNNFYQPSTLAEFFACRMKAPYAAPFTCDVLRLQQQRGQRIAIPAQFISLDSIEELKKISRTERYLEIGSKVTLREVLKLGRSVPNILRQVLEDTASPLLQQLISFGGCLYSGGRQSDVVAALAALDARCELRASAAPGRWLSAAHYAAAEPEAAFNSELLTRVRLPLDEWNYSIYRRIKTDDEKGGGMTLLLLAKIQKDLLTDIRVTLASGAVYREKGAESFLTGKHLPLLERDAKHVASLWRAGLNDTDAFGPLQLEIAVQCIESSIMRFIA
jgi:CO/xanthine dehydrogenase FAD-binding subunit